MHRTSVTRHAPAESTHALDLDGLRAPDVTFWSVWDGPELVGGGALRELDARHGEIKSMRTVPAHLRRGVGTAVVEHILAVARARGYDRVSLETGEQDAFVPARALYAHLGFVPCGAFGSYRDDPHSVYLTRVLDPGGPS